eukprot:gene3097-3563_t
MKIFRNAEAEMVYPGNAVIMRPGDLCEEPHMIYAVSSLSIRQTVVSDCSFVASLAISAAYERKFKKQLITGVIYPQNKNGKPIINPCGKYMVKLTINGVRRKVVIDDTLPLGKDGQLLCSYSNNSDEFWVSLLEKAYIKVMGGYDFPGSNSNIDLGALTGWIPERFSLKNDEVNKTRMFERMFEGLHRGDVLITVATGFLSEVEAERTGLVPTHAYAVLDIRKIQDLWLLQLKNPWNHLRWKGRFSETDTESWTPDLLRALNYDRREALQNDNGVFWINWESVCRFFDVFYMSWNPKLFQYKFTIHSKWQATKGPIKDSYNIGDNPQYKLTVHSGDSASIVWILLTRHITERDDFADNKEFITVHVYKSPNDNARVYYPDKAYIEGTKINSPHYLTKMQPSKGTQNYTLVISQYEKYNTIFYTLKVYGTVKFELRPVLDPFTSRKRLTGNWTKASAGGSANHASYSSNPKFDLEIISNTPCSLLIKIEAPKQFAVGAEIVSQDGSFKKSSGDYRWGFMAFELQDVPLVATRSSRRHFYLDKKASSFSKSPHQQPSTYVALIGVLIIPVVTRPTVMLLRGPERFPSVHKRVQLAHKLGSLVAIRPDGRICISPISNDKNTFIKLWPYGGGYFRIQGEASGLYIAMNANGIVHTTRLANDETLFRHRMTSSLYHTFESNAHRGFFLGFKKRRGVPSRGNRTSFWKKTAHFIVLERKTPTKISELDEKIRAIWEAQLKRSGQSGRRS